MTLFSELYGCYYTVAAHILRQAHGLGLSRTEINTLVEQHAFSESGFHLIPRLTGGDWSLLRETDGKYVSKLKHKETALPLTLLQKSWLKALLRDRRIRLFLDAAEISRLEEQFSDVNPLFLPEDFHVFDAASDADDYTDEEYIKRFRAFLSAIKEKKALLVEYESGRGERMTIHFLPQRLMYSAKDDKFRAIGRKMTRKGSKSIVLNLSRIKHLTASQSPAYPAFPETRKSETASTVHIAILDERNALERCMLQFASYDKRTQFDEESGRYLCDIHYDMREETELLIRILSFGPVVEVLGPEKFTAQVQDRVRMQIERIQTELGE